MRHHKLLVAAALTAAFGGACALSTRQVADIRQYPGRFDRRSVSIEGTVTSAWAVPLVPLEFYKVDDGTGEITVVTSDTRVPRRGAHVRVRGRVEELAMIGGRDYGLHLRQERLTVYRW